MLITKSELRKTAQREIALLGASYNRDASFEICHKLTMLEAYRAASVVFCFVGTHSEIDTTNFLNAVLNDNKTLCVPLCTKITSGSTVQKFMQAHIIKDLSVLKEGYYGIKEPPHTAPIAPGHIIDFVVLPCLCATASGARLGYGGGYYDKFAPLLKKDCFTATVCRDKMLKPNGTIPTEPHDFIADAVITQSEIFYKSGQING